MPFGLQKVDVNTCERAEPPHPCDDPPFCDPHNQKGACPEPYLCTERIKHPATGDELTHCLPGKHINAKSCKRVEPPHPCDLLPCSLVRRVVLKRKFKPVCLDPVLCLERIKNFEPYPKMDPCDPRR